MTQINFLRASACFVLCTSIFLGGCGSNPVAQGVTNNQLADCPSSPNCISSTADDEDQHYPALPYQGTQEQAKNKLIEILHTYPGAEISKNNDNYVHAEFTTAIMRFTDDAEFLILEDGIQVRSASRVGYSDLGKNRSRMEEIRESFEPCCP